MLGIIIRNNFLEVQASYSEMFLHTFSTLCFIGLHFAIRFAVQILASRLTMGYIREKEAYNRKEIIGFLMSERFSVFSGLLYLSRYLGDSKSPPMLYLASLTQVFDSHADCGDPRDGPTSDNNILLRRQQTVPQKEHIRPQLKAESNAKHLRGHCEQVGAHAPSDLEYADKQRSTGHDRRPAQRLRDCRGNKCVL